MPSDMIVREVTDSRRFNIYSGLLRAYMGDDGRRRLHGVASSTIVDRHGDTMLLSALQDMERAANNNLTIFLNHSYEVPEDVFGSVEKAAISPRGEFYDLDFDMVVNEANPRALEAHAAISSGVKLGISIGAMIPDGGAKPKDTKAGMYGPLNFEHVDLLEGSVVGIPANPRSWVEYAAKAFRKSLDGTRVFRLEPDVLKDVQETTHVHGHAHAHSHAHSHGWEGSADYVKHDHDHAHRHSHEHDDGHHEADDDQNDYQHDHWHNDSTDEEHAHTASEALDGIGTAAAVNGWSLCQNCTTVVEGLFENGECPTCKSRGPFLFSHSELPDSAFACVSPGGEKGKDGKTHPLSLRHYPHHTAGGGVDKALLRNALARVEQDGNEQCGKAHLEAHAKSLGMGDAKSLSDVDLVEALADGTDVHHFLKAADDEQDGGGGGDGNTTDSGDDRPDFTHEHDHAHRHEHEHSHDDGELTHSHDHAHVHNHGHGHGGPDDHPHDEEMHSEDHDHSHDGSDGDHPHGEPDADDNGGPSDNDADDEKKSTKKALVTVQTPKATVWVDTEDADTDESKSVKDKDKKNSDESQPQGAPASNPDSGPDGLKDETADGDDQALGDAITHSVHSTLQLLEGVTSELLEERRMRVDADLKVTALTTENERLTEIATKVLTSTKSILEQVAATPMGRKATMRAAYNSYATLEAMYGEEFLKLALKE